ncbi:MAG: VWA domain-containing protein [bacterium]
MASLVAIVCRGRRVRVLAAGGARRRVHRGADGRGGAARPSAVRAARDPIAPGARGDSRPGRDHRGRPGLSQSRRAARGGRLLVSAPTNAAVSRFSIEIDGKEQDAELVDAARARTIYEDIVRRMRDPALLEYGDRGAFRVRVFPIEPHATRRVKLAYTQVLPRDGATIEYTYPLETEKLSAGPIDTVSVEVHIESRQPLESVWSPSHTVEVKRKGAGEALVGFEQSRARPDAAFRLFYTTAERAGLGLGVLTFRDSAEDDGYFLLLASPGALGEGQVVLAKDVVFVVDTSGSMAGAKIEQLRRALTRAIDTLKDGDRFEIVRFSTEAEPFFGQLVAANAGNRERARSFVAGFHAAGGTAIGEALARGLAAARERDASRPLVVVLVTDGLPTVGETDAGRLVASVAGSASAAGARVFSFGVGDDVDTRLLDGLSDATRGRSQYVGSRQDIEREVSSFCERIASPALTGLALRVEGDVRASKVYPRELPDLFHGDQLVALGRFTGSGSARVVLEGMANGEKRTATATVEFASARGSGDYGFIPRLWATRRVGQLLDEVRRHGEQTELRDEIVSLARRYGIVTPYTSYLIVEDERRKDLPAPVATVPPAAREAPSRDAMASAFRALEGKISGADAVAGARVTDALKHAESLDQQAAIVNRVLGDAKADAGAASSGGVAAAFQVAANGEPRHVAGKVFYPSGTRWIDAEVAEHPRETRKPLVFGSPAYFELARRSRAAAAWLALGRELTVRVDGTIYEITPAADRVE